MRAQSEKRRSTALKRVTRRGSSRNCDPGSTWRRIEGWLGAIKNAGDWFGVSDLLIAGIAAEHGAAIWSLDSDFTRMANLKFISLHRVA
jgi:predicted nucleic acid-binding protein